MPSRARHPKKPPVATRRKRLMHALYLAQPFLQFVALMAVLFVLARCSPLAPSTDKSVLKTTSAGAIATRNEKGESTAEEQDIQRDLKDVGSLEDLPLISQADFAKRVLPNALLAERGSDLPALQNLLRQRDRQRGLQRDVRLLVVRLLPADKEAFFKSGSVRVKLHEALANMAPEVRKYYFTELDKLSRAGDLAAKAYLVLSDDDMAAPDAVPSIPVSVKLQLAISQTNDKAWLQASRVRLDDQQQKLIESAKEKSIAMALVLE